ncbi:MAG: hypothetical protein HY974_02005 [Candidatus Kerfeldbacteria bacterium]|nr:hypothetical protein [Candidatus Kerfeldbacteria bacterium]
MYLSVHTAAGLGLARVIPNPIAAFAAGLLSHFVLDFIPHGDEFLADSAFTRARIRRRLLGAAFLDGIILVIFLLIYLWTTPQLNLNVVAAAVIGSLLPDAINGFYLITQAPLFKRYVHWHAKLHNLPGHELSWQKGILVQGLTFAALWLLLI